MCTFVEPPRHSLLSRSRTNVGVESFTFNTDSTNPPLPLLSLPLQRQFSTSEAAAALQVTTLGNGVTVVTDDAVSMASTLTVSVASGSRNESAANAGVTGILKKVSAVYRCFQSLICLFDYHLASNGERASWPGMWQTVSPLLRVCSLDIEFYVVC